MIEAKLKRLIPVPAPEAVWRRVSHRPVLRGFLLPAAIALLIGIPLLFVMNAPVTPTPLVVELGPKDADRADPPTSDNAMRGGNLRRTGVYASKSIDREPQLLWKFTTEGGVLCTPAVADGVVCFGTGAGIFYALDASTGALKWRFLAHAFSEPAIAGQTVYFYAASPKESESCLYALDLKTGEKKWSSRVDGGVAGSPAICGGMVYCSNEEGFLALDATTGRERWKRYGDSSQPAVYRGVVYIVEEKAKLQALNAKSGESLWSFQCHGLFTSAAPAIEDNVAFICTQSGDSDFSITDMWVTAIDLLGKKELWRYETKLGASHGVAVSHGIVVLNGEDEHSRIQAIDLQTGREKWNCVIPGWLAHGSTIAGNVLYVSNGRPCSVQAYELDSGRPLWKFETKERVFSPPSIVKGVLYVGDMKTETMPKGEGHVYALR